MDVLLSSHLRVKSSQLDKLRSRSFIMSERFRDCQLPAGNWDDIPDTPVATAPAGSPPRFTSQKEIISLNYEISVFNANSYAPGLLRLLRITETQPPDLIRPGSCSPVPPVFKTVEHATASRVSRRRHLETGIRLTDPVNASAWSLASHSKCYCRCKICTAVK